MFKREIDNELRLELTMPHHAKALFDVVDRNREFFSQWFPWVEDTKEPKDTEEFIKSRLELFAKGKTLHTTIIYRDRVVGVLDFNSINRGNKRAVIGYWLDEAHTKKGIMTRAVKELINIGFRYYELEKVTIECDVKNCGSCGIAKRLGFTHEGVLRKHYLVNGVHGDFNSYGLLREDWSLDEQN